MANVHFEPLVRAAGLGFEPVGTHEQHAEWIAKPDLWHPRRGPGVVMRGMGEMLRELYDALNAARDRDTVVVASSLAGIAARVAYDVERFAFVSAHLSPLCVRSVHELPRLPGPIGLNWLPARFRRGFWDGADKWFIDPLILPQVNALRGEVGLPPTARVLNGWWQSPRLTLGFWPDWFARPRPDWPANTRLVGFPLFDERGVTPLPSELAAWLDAPGGPPVAFTPGSAMTFGRQFFEASADACARLGRRGLLLTRHADQVPARLPDGVKHFAYAPFSELLPRCAALVAHGGVGTTAQGLVAGVPQLVMPMSHDQFDNAERVRALGCGDWVTRGRYTARRAARVLGRLLGDERVASACKRVAARFAGVDALAAACGLVEESAAREPDFAAA